MKNQEPTANHDTHPDAQKRKWPYSDNGSFEPYPSDTLPPAKKFIAGTAFDYYQPTQQYQMIATDTQDQRIQQHCETAQLIDSMEMNENIEYVNILYDDDLLSNMQAPVATETNYINFEPNWSNADILDLDQRNYFYGATGDVTNLSGQLIQQTPQNNIIAEQSHAQQPQNGSMPNQSQPPIQQATEYEVLHSTFVHSGNGQENPASNIGKSQQIKLLKGVETWKSIFRWNRRKKRKNRKFAVWFSWQAKRWHWSQFGIVFQLDSDIAIKCRGFRYYPLAVRGRYARIVCRSTKCNKHKFFARPDSPHRHK